jgi:hypothetical protein
MKKSFNFSTENFINCVTRQLRHAQQAAAARALAGEGVPYLIDQYSVKSTNDT